MSVPATKALSIDVNALGNLKRDARADPQQAVKSASSQFEALFVQMLLKSMREATPSFDPLSGSATKTYQGLLDEQWSKVIAEKGIGLAPLIERQLSRNLPGQGTEAVRGAGAPAQPRSGAVRTEAARAVPMSPPGEKEQAFVNRMVQPAMQAARATGLPPAFIIGQAALESGWGQREIRGPNGQPSYNLFGIKAGPGWKGASVEATTQEFAEGRMQKQVERFRAYGSYAEAFEDYARLLTQSPRYAGALAQRDDPGRFAQAIASAGYATDPGYAHKLAGTIRRAMAVPA